MFDSTQAPVNKSDTICRCTLSGHIFCVSGFVYKYNTIQIFLFPIKEPFRAEQLTKNLIKDEVLLMVSCPIFPSILIAKNLLTGSLKNKSIDNLEAQKKSISMKNSQFFDYLLYAKSK